MSDPQTEILIKAATGIFTEIFKGAYKTTLKWIKDQNEIHDFFNKKAEAYGEKMANRYNNMKVLGMSEPRPLNSIFVRANILEKITSREYTKLEDLEDQFDFQKRGFGIKKETKLGLEVAQSIDKFILLGKPGAGKTTFLKRIVLHSLEGDFTYHRLPIFIGLKEYSESGKTLFEYILREFDICSLPDAKQFITNILKNGKGQILLDGLDEVKQENEARVIQEIKNLSAKYEGCQYILSCRIAAFNAIFEHFTDVEIADFNDEQIQQFITNWFNKELKIGNECWEKVKENPQIQELATIPLLLTLICILYEEALDFPENRAELYEEVIDTMLKKWDSTRRIKRRGEKNYKSLSFKKQKTLLSIIAFQTFSQGEFFIPKRRLAKLIGSYIENLSQIKENSIEVESQEVLDSIIAHHGLIVPRAKDIYSYSHLSLQEYFTANFLISGFEDEKLIKYAVEEYAQNPQWREIFLLIAGILNKADRFIITLKNYIDQYAREKQISIYLSEIDEMIKPNSYLFQKRGGQVIIIFFLFAYGSQAYANSHVQVLVRDLAFKLAIAINRDLDRTLDNALSFASDISALSDRTPQSIFRRTITQAIEHTNNRALASSLVRAFSRARKNNLLPPSDDFSLTLNSYLNLNQLLIDCLNSGAYVSNRVRKDILDNLLLPPPEQEANPPLA